MEIIGNFFCLTAFILTYFYSDIYTATYVLMFCSVLLLLGLKMTTGIEKKHYLVTASILFLGGLTIWFQNELFIKIKPTLVFIALATTLSISRFGYNKSWCAPLLRPQFPALPESYFVTTDHLAIAFYTTIALLNLVIAFFFSTHVWVAFKTVGILVMNTLFFSLLFVYLQQKEKLAKQKINQL